MLKNGIIFWNMVLFVWKNISKFLLIIKMWLHDLWYCCIIEIYTLELMIMIRIKVYLYFDLVIKMEWGYIGKCHIINEICIDIKMERKQKIEDTWKRIEK